jgi:hypothetical protein
MGSFQDKPLALALSPQAGRGDDLFQSGLLMLARVRDDGGRVHRLLPVKTGRRWPTGRMRGMSQNLQMGVTTSAHKIVFLTRGGITPPRTFGPTLPLKGRVS